MHERLSATSNIANAVTHAQRIHQLRESLHFSSLRDVDEPTKKQAKACFKYLAAYDLVGEIVIGACGRAAMAGALYHGWSAKGMIGQGIDYMSTSNEILDQIEDVSHHVDLQAQATGGMMIDEMKIPALFRVNGAQELDQLNRKAQAICPGFDVEKVVFSEANNFSDLMSLGRFYRTCVKEQIETLDTDIMTILEALQKQRSAHYSRSMK